MPFKLHAPYQPAGDQPKAIDEVQAKEKTLALQILSRL